MSDPNQPQSLPQQSARDIDDDAPMTLEEACRVIFAGAIKPATLLAEARRGRLVMERVGRRNFVTRGGIKAMREACRVEPTSPRVPAAWKPPRGEPPHQGPSDMTLAGMALDAALESLRKQRKPSRRSLRKRAGSQQ